MFWAVTASAADRHPSASGLVLGVDARRRRASAGATREAVSSIDRAGRRPVCLSPCPAACGLMRPLPASRSQERGSRKKAPPSEEREDAGRRVGESPKRDGGGIRARGPRRARRDVNPEGGLQAAGPGLGSSGQKPSFLTLSTC